MPSKDKKRIEGAIRGRFLQALEELKARDGIPYYQVLESVGSMQQDHKPMKEGRRMPTLYNAVMLCTLYKYRIEWLMMGTGPKRAMKERDPIKRIDDIETELQQIRKKLS